MTSFTKLEFVILTIIFFIVQTSILISRVNAYIFPSDILFVKDKINNISQI